MISKPRWTAASFPVKILTQKLNSNPNSANGYPHMLQHFGNWISVRDHSRSDRPTDRTSVDLQRKERSHKMLLTSYKNWRRQHPLQGMHCHDVWHHHIRKTPFLSVHSKRMSRPWSRLFQKTTLWGPFSITSVCRVQKRLGGRKAKTEEKNLRFQKYPDKYGRDPRCVRQ